MLSFTTVVSGEAVGEALLNDDEEFAVCLGYIADRVKADSAKSTELKDALEEQFSYGELENIQKFAYVLARHAEELMTEKA